MAGNARNGKVAAGGSEMEYAVFGHGPRTLTVLPGLSDGLATVRGKAMLLAGPYRAVSDEYTVYLFSRINGLPEGYSITDMADDQAEALAALGVEKTAVLGVSQGGMIAQVLAERHPDLVEKLVLAVTAPSANETVKACVTRWIGFAERADHKALMTDTAERSYSEAYLKKYRKFYPMLGLVGKPKDYRRFLANARAILGFDGREELAKIACPTLVIGGEDDRIVGAAASGELHEGIAGSRLYLYPGLGHGAYEEAKDFYARVFAFLKEN